MLTCKHYRPGAFKLENVKWLLICMIFSQLSSYIKSKYISTIELVYVSIMSKPCKRIL